MSSDGDRSGRMKTLSQAQNMWEGETYFVGWRLLLRLRLSRVVVTVEVLDNKQLGKVGAWE